MSLDYVTTTYPKNLSYHMDRIVNYSKQPIKLWCDRTGTINHQETIRFKLPNNCLVDLDSLYWMFDFTTNQNGTADESCRFFPRNSSSIIDALYVYANGNLIDPTNYYNHLYNLMADATCGKDFYTSGIRHLENVDPSLKYLANGTNTITSKATQTEAVSDIGRRFCVSNWLGFLGTSSTRILDTSFLGDVVIEIRLAEPNITFVGGGVAISPVASTYSINGSTTYMSINRITFGDSVYYDLLRSIVDQSGLLVGYKTYSAHRGNSFTKAAGTFTHSFNVNANHLTKLIGTLLINDYATEGKLEVSPAANIEKTWLEALPLEGTLIAFNQSRYFKKNASALTEIQWDINGVSQYPQPLNKEDVFYQNLISLNLDSDIQSGCHPGCRSMIDFLNCYFMNILSFEHIQNTDSFVLEGLDGKASAISCKWSLTFSGAGTDSSVIPLVFAEKQNVLRIGVGQQLQIL